ncbi:MAG: leucyl aminopeptidase [Candidatus Latescibacteria bacterium]|nr:leucyl aminopeptidase [Candidatus Latescibacterota bacterium]
MKITLSRTTPATCKDDALAVGVFEPAAVDTPHLRELDSITGGLVSDAMAGPEFSAKEGELLLLHRPQGLGVRRLLIAGLGKKEEYSQETCRRLGGMASRRLRKQGMKTVAVALPGEVTDSAGIQACVEGFLIGPGDIDAYKTEQKTKKKDPYRGEYTRLILLCPGPITQSMRDAARRGEVVADGMILVRRLVNTPSNLMTPVVLAAEARRACRPAGVSVTVLNEKQLRDRGFGGVLAVSGGSSNPPRFIVMRYRPEGERKRKKPPLALVGKGITFDSGGISLKPVANMEEMKADMAGAAAVIGAMAAIGHLKPSRPVIGIVPACENMPSGRAVKPGDVIKTYSGKTIEVLNTDAEGRLILADGLAYALEQKPAAIVDVATLTGACVVALGHVYAGLMGNDDEWVKTVRETAAAHGEKAWPLPMDREYNELVKSDIADVRNTGKDSPGAITAAKLLEKFAGNTPWAHLDIAGMEWRKEATAWIGSGPTGYGVRTFVALAFILKTA